MSALVLVSVALGMFGGLVPVWLLRRRLRSVANDPALLSRWQAFERRIKSLAMVSGALSGFVATALEWVFRPSLATVWKVGEGTGGVVVGVLVGAAIIRLVPQKYGTIRRAPGSRLLVLAELYSYKTRERIFDQIIADTREEWCAAMAEGRRAKAAWIRVRGVWSFGSAVLAHGLGSILKTAWNIWRETR